MAMHLERALNALEQERQRVAKDLHDDVTPMLAIHKLQLEKLHTKTHILAELMQMVNNVEVMYHELRRIASGITTPTFKGNNLFELLRYNIGRYQQDLPFSITLKLPKQPADISPFYELNIYRIINELILNTTKYAKASELIIVATHNKKMLRFEITDNGCGCDFNVLIHRKEGLGLRNIISRIEAMNGSYTLRTAPGKGFAFSFTVPMRTTVTN